MSTKKRSESETLVSKAIKGLREKGIRYVASGVARRIKSRWRISIYLPFWYKYYEVFHSRNKFTFQNNEYKYFYHWYNLTWRNERAIEIPIIWSIVKSCNCNTLEIGNVLSHYFTFSHDIVDKYEVAEGVVNKDVTEISSSKKYDLIISISTLEHVGWDEKPGGKEITDDSDKILSAIEKLESLLTPTGRIIVTLPLGYNPYLDKLLLNGQLKFDRQHYLKRISKSKWVEADGKEVEHAKYDHKIPSANALLIGIIENEKK